MQQKIAKSGILIAMSLCLSVIGLLVGMLLTLWNEGWLIGKMEQTEYYAVAAQTARADCGAIIAQSGVLSNLVEQFIPDDVVRQDIILSTDALFRNTGAVSTSRFSNLKTVIEDVIYEETQQILSEADQFVNNAVQFQCEQQYAQSIKTPFLTAISILLQYKQISTMLLVATLLIFIIGAVGLFLLSKDYQQLLSSFSTVLAASGLSLFLLGIVVFLSGFQNWMPTQNIECALFISWFQGMPISCIVIGILLMVSAVGLMWYAPKLDKGAVK